MLEPDPPAAALPNPSDVLRAHVDRYLGPAGVRLVRLTASIDERPAPSYYIVHAWRIGHGECASLFCVLEPGSLSRTTVLLRERPFDPNPRIWVKLATAQHPALLSPARVEEHILGTDFTYDELRTWTPRFITAATHLELAVEPNDCFVVIRSEWLYRR